jgi:hypothetical protein
VHTRPPLSRQTTEAQTRTQAHTRALCQSPSLPPLSCTCLVCESGAPRMQLEPQLLASQRDVAQTSTDSVLRDSRVLSPNKRMSEWRVKKFGDLCFMIHLGDVGGSGYDPGKKKKKQYFTTVRHHIYSDYHY